MFDGLWQFPWHFAATPMFNIICWVLERSFKTMSNELMSVCMFWFRPEPWGGSFFNGLFGNRGALDIKRITRRILSVLPKRRDLRWVPLRCSSSSPERFMPPFSIQMNLVINRSWALAQLLKKVHYLEMFASKPCFSLGFHKVYLHIIWRQFKRNLDFIFPIFLPAALDHRFHSEESLCCDVFVNGDLHLTIVAAGCS